jgi:hypothetical protein
MDSQRFETDTRSFVLGIDAMQLAEPLLDESHAVRLRAMWIPVSRPEGIPAGLTAEEARLRCFSVYGLLW